MTIAAISSSTPTLVASPPPPAPPAAPAVASMSAVASAPHTTASALSPATAVAATGAVSSTSSKALTITLSGTGSPQFHILVDGKDVTGQITTSANYAKDQWQTLTINGPFAGAKSVDIVNTGDAAGGGALFVKQISVGGHSYQAIDAAFNRDYQGTTSFTPGTGTENLYWNGDLHFTTDGSGPSTTPPVTISTPAVGLPTVAAPAPGKGLVVTVSADQNAEFRILVDGKDVTGRLTATANNSQGQWQTVTVAGDFSKAKTVDVQYLNDDESVALGKNINLYVHALSVNGQTQLATSGEFNQQYQGTTNFTPGTGTQNLYWTGDLRFTGVGAAQPAPPTGPVSPPSPPPPATGNVLTVGVGKQFQSIGAAVAAAKSGDVVQISAGTYVNDVANIDKNLTIEGVGGPVILTETQNLSNRKAYFVVNGNVTVEGITFQNATVSAADGNNGAGIRLESGNLVVKNDVFKNNQEGILTTGNPNATLTVQGSTFLGNGDGSGYTHGIYAGTIASLSVTDSSFEGTKAGHDVKSRAAKTTISGNTFDDNATASYAVDLPNAGSAVVSNNVIAKGSQTQNTAAIHYGGEVSNPIGSLTVSGNTIVNQRAGGIAVLDQTNLAVKLINNQLYGETTLVAGGPAMLSGNVVAAKPPTKLPLPIGYNKTGNTVLTDLLNSFHLTA